ncbi:peptidase, U32 family [Bacteriovorax sp. BAL6_X]|uniref:peptidase U32 family protein n=1 Tax=Bacteriovorax sp. BAL6_X TaxID=1201290 RepID=UPI000386D24B|nr:U32 family peptidase [Bacteriovorax sp. BAL6_X]EPZ51058.1 peptidase, U32 family [Bacteriovorax sp. BAL6_X]
MKTTTYLNNLNDLPNIIANKSLVSEVILATRLFSQVGKLSIEEMVHAVELLKSEAISYSLEWDILMTETRFAMYKQQFQKYADLGFKSIRLRDPGAINFCLNEYPDLMIDLLLDTGGHHNLNSIKVWKKLIGDRLRKIVLSIELSSSVIKEFCQEIHSWGIETELLVFGRILLFYTPRNLVSPLYSDESLENDYLEVSGSSEESPHKGFPIVENQHGTFMFNTKDQFLLEYIDELKDCGVNDLRVDTRHLENNELLNDVVSLINSFDKLKAKEIKDQFGNSTTRGFFHVNKSDVLFKKLKNKRTQRQDEGFLGEVVDVVKKSHMAILIKGMRGKEFALKVGDELRLNTPDGKIKTTKVHKITHTNGRESDYAKTGELVLIPHVSGVSVKTMAYKN